MECEPRSGLLHSNVERGLLWSWDGRVRIHCPALSTGSAWGLLLVQMAPLPLQVSSGPGTFSPVTQQNQTACSPSDDYHKQLHTWGGGRVKCASQRSSA